MNNVDLQPVADFIKNELKSELARQGKQASGKLYNSINSDIETLVDGWNITIHTGDVTYGRYVDWGRKANPSYEFGQGAGHNSKMFEAMLAWAKIRKSGLSGSKQRSFAFMAMRHVKRYGVKPSNFVEIVLETKDADIKRMITDIVGDYYQIIVNNIVEKERLEYKTL